MIRKVLLKLFGMYLEKAAKLFTGNGEIISNNTLLFKEPLFLVNSLSKYQFAISIYHNKINEHDSLKMI